MARLGFFELALIIFVVVSIWKTFSKAGKPGWASIIPIYNIYIVVKMAKRPWWWLLLLLIPYVNIIFYIIVNIDVAKHFGEGVGFGLGLSLLPFVFYPILAFSKVKYIG